MIFVIHNVSGISAAIGATDNASTVDSIPAVAGLPSATFVCDAPIVPAALHPAVANVLVASPAAVTVPNVPGISVVADFPTDSGSPTAVDIHGAMLSLLLLSFLMFMVFLL